MPLILTDAVDSTKLSGAIGYAACAELRAAHDASRPFWSPAISDAALPRTHIERLAQRVNRHPALGGLLDDVFALPVAPR